MHEGIRLITNQQLIDSKYVLSSCIELAEWMSSQEVVGVDTETSGLDPHTKDLLLIQIGNADLQFVIDYQTLTYEDRECLKAVFQLPVLKVFHNAKFDLKFLWKAGFSVDNIYCTMVGEKLLYAGLPVEKTLMPDIAMKLPSGYTIGKRKGNTQTGFYSLQRLVWSYCKAFLPKEVRSQINKEGLTNRVIEYSARDVVFLPEIYYQQISKLKSKGLYKDNGSGVTTLEMFSIYPMAEIEYRGMKLDYNKWPNTLVAIKDNIDTEYQKVFDRVGREYPDDITTDFTLFGETNNLSFDIDSPAQKLKFLKKHIPSIESTSERELNKYKEDYLICRDLLDYSKATKLRNAFGNKLEQLVNPHTGRIHTDIEQVLNTGRISTSRPCLHQIPSRSKIGTIIRSSFVPENGKVYVACDYSQQELRLLAQLSKEPVWLDIFNQGKDLHSLQASITFGVDVDKVKGKSKINPDMSYRDIQKIINFGLAYGMSAYKLSDTIAVSKEEAQSIIDNFFGVVPILEKYLKESGLYASKYKEARTMIGRARFFEYPENFSERSAIERAGKNHPIQGSGADMVKLALCYLYRRFKNTDTNIVLQIHDEIILECPINQAEEVKYYLEYEMGEAAKVFLPDVPMPLEASINSYWSK